MKIRTSIKEQTALRGIMYYSKKLLMIVIYKGAWEYDGCGTLALSLLFSCSYFFAPVDVINSGECLYCAASNIVFDKATIEASPKIEWNFLELVSRKLILRENFMFSLIVCGNYDAFIYKNELFNSFLLF